MKIFFSYPHDANADFVKRLKDDLKSRGHEVWFDAEKIKTGDEWRNIITRGILDTDTVVAFLSKHGVRDPGVCLNEIAIALAEKGDDAIVTVLVEPEKEVSAPVSITHIQWLNMADHNTLASDEGWYRAHFDELVKVIEHPGSATRNAELEQLRLVLNPLSFNADIADQLRRFTGREWLISRYEGWLSNQPPGHTSKVFRIEGGPGMGKTAVTSHLVHSAKSSVLAVHLCKSGSSQTHNPHRLVMSLAYQIATRLPDYRARLLKVPCIINPALLQGEDAGSLWDTLISEPMAGAGKTGLIDRQRLSIVIDGLDEATRNGKNEIVELLVDHIQTLPAWIGVVLTGRPDPELVQSLKQYAPQTISGDDPANLEDLKHYIDAWLAEEVQAKRLPTDQVLAITQVLLQKSEGAFLYLAQARDESEQSVKDGSKTFDLSNPATLPSGLNALYLKSFKRRFPEATSDPDNPATRWNALAKPLLGYILASPEPLPLDLARELMGWDADSAGNEKQHKALQSLGSLVKRNGDAAKPETCTLAPFHNSVREWLSAEVSQDFRVFSESSLYALTDATWNRYLRNESGDAYGWQVLPRLLPRLDADQRGKLFGEPNSETSRVLFLLADSLAPKLRFKEAAATWKIVVESYERLSRSAPEDARFAFNLSLSYRGLGDMQSALGNSEAALALYQQSLEINERLFRSAPENADFASNLGASYDKLGGMQNALGNSQAALALYQQGREIREILFRCAPENADFAFNLSLSYSKLGDIQNALGNSQAALALYQQSLEIRERLSRSDPDNADSAFSLGASYSKLGGMQNALGNSQAALALYQQSLEIDERLFGSDPGNAKFAFNLSLNYDMLGDMQKALGNSQAALGLYQQSLEIREHLSRGAPENADFASNLGYSYSNLGDIQKALGNSQAALGLYQQSLEINERLSRSAPENFVFAYNLSFSYGNLGDIQKALGNSQAALALYQKRLEINERLFRSDPENVVLARNLGASYDIEGDLQNALGNRHAALALYQQSLEINERLFRNDPGSAKFATSLGDSYERLGDMQKALGNSQAALALYQRSREIAEGRTTKNVASFRISGNPAANYGIKWSLPKTK